MPLAMLWYNLSSSWYAADLLYNSFGITSILLVLLGIRINAPDPPRPWWIFLSGLTLYVAGDVIVTIYLTVLEIEPPSPYAADLAYLAGMLLMTTGVACFVRYRTGGQDRTALVDSMILATGFGIITWTFFISPQMADTGLSSFARLLSFMYPLLDVVMLVTLARMAFSSGTRSVAYLSISAAFSMLFISDFVYNVISAGSGAMYSPLVESLWLVVYGMTAIAAMHPSMRQLTDRIVVTYDATPRQRVWLLGGASLLGPAAFVSQQYQSDPLGVPVIASGASFMALLVIQRLRHVVSAQREIAQRERVIRDATSQLASSKNVPEVITAVHSAVREMSDRAVVRMMTLRDEGRLQITTPDASSSVLLEEIPEALAAALTERRPFVVSGEAEEPLTALGLDASDRFVVVAPFGDEASLRGAIVASGPAVENPAFRAGIISIATQASLTLESAARAEDAVRQESRARFESLVRQTSDIIAVLSDDDRVQYSSPAIFRMLGRDPAELIGHDLSGVVHIDDWDRFSADLDRLQASPGEFTGEYRLVRGDGSARQVEAIFTNLVDDPAVGGVVLNMRDISDRKEAEHLLAHQAYHDALTRLPNRALFLDRLDQAILSAMRHSERVGILFLDLDGFKRVNDSLGHEAGDKLLIEIANRLRRGIGKQHTVARLGGDEFTVLIETVEDFTELSSLARQVIDYVSAPIELAEQTVFVGASIGIAVGDPHHDSANDLLRMADIAMYRAKADGKGKFQIFQSGMDIEAARQLDLTTDLRNAIARDQFVLDYQPQIALETGRIAGFEALLRWHHPTRGVISPAEFIPLAEETGLIVSIGEWVIDTAAAQAAEWLAMFSGSAPSVNVNISARQLAHGDFAGTVSSAVRRHSLPPELLLLELVETTLITDDASTKALLRRLRGLGVRLAIDDFGSAYSSLAYLLHLPISNVKIDRSFVIDLDREGDAFAIVEAVIHLAHRLKISVTAEGIETPTQVLQLAELGCDFGQGYYFSPGVSAADATRLLSTTIAHLNSP